MGLRKEAEEALSQLFREAPLTEGALVVIGCSSSEVAGKPIGSASSLAVAKELVTGFEAAAEEGKLTLAYQCCEHLNRALAIDGREASRRGLAVVSAFPMPGAGGAVACAAMLFDSRRVLVEALLADAGLDVGQTLVGMHIRPVAKPLRLRRRTIGQAVLTAAYSRPRLIGGQRALSGRPEGVTW